MKMLSVYLIFACTVAIGESVPHNWRYSNPSYHSYRPQRWRYNPYRHYHDQSRGHKPYYHYRKTHGKTVVEDDGIVDKHLKLIKKYFNLRLGGCLRKIFINGHDS